MSDLVDPADAVRIVGVERHPTEHWARADSATSVVTILHSAECKASTPDLRDCPFSLALDRGIDGAVIPWSRWREAQDRPVRVVLLQGWLTPAVSS